VFCAATTASVRGFQEARGLHTSGVCDEQTWLALIEAGWQLGDRLLVLTAPQLRGDDVVALQTMMSHLGFDCGRPDGILGPATTRALADFQRNSGLAVDGICGPKTVRMLEVLSRQSGGGPGVASVRERVAMQFGEGSLATQRLVIGQFGGLSAIARSTARALREQGATVMSTDEYEAAAQAAAANRFGASAYVGFEARADASSTVSYFGVPTFESVGGRSLAIRIVTGLADVSIAEPRIQGMRLPVLRETRMPAVLCSLGPVRDVVDSTDSISSAIVAAVTSWTADPLSGRPQHAANSASSPEP
jgi:N-acetylmuramoyl-L-alanine amidase